jgi:hypothetical protein
VLSVCRKRRACSISTQRPQRGLPHVDGPSGGDLLTPLPPAVVGNLINSGAGMICSALPKSRRAIICPNSVLASVVSATPMEPDRAPIACAVNCPKAPRRLSLARRPPLRRASWGASTSNGGGGGPKGQAGRRQNPKTVTTGQVQPIAAALGGHAPRPFAGRPQQRFSAVGHPQPARRCHAFSFSLNDAHLSVYQQWLQCPVQLLG